MDELHYVDMANVHFDKGSDMEPTAKPAGARRAWIPAATLVLGLGVALAGAPVASAGVGDLVNVTINIPATEYDNPCTGEPVGLHGDMHILISTRIDQAGHYHYLSGLNASYSGTGLVSGTPYTASERQHESWTAHQLPASHTTTSVVKLISKGAAPNAFLYTTTTTTVDADGVPTPTVDNVWVQCRG